MSNLKVKSGTEKMSEVQTDKEGKTQQEWGKQEEIGEKGEVIIFRKRTDSKVLKE